ncbi:hypothetical protein KW782_04695 [Candidatus Parcubacteria bacterium]|nr:hypothetical protein [Candidatus Parcubacteria bacterium]
MPTRSEASRESIWSTTQVANLCRVAPRTVSKWFDNGHLKGFVIPGSKERRIPFANVVEFIKANKMPIEWLWPHMRRLLIVDRDSDTSAVIAGVVSNSEDCIVQTADESFSAAIRLTEFKPGIIILDVEMPGIDLAQWEARLASTPELKVTRLVISADPLVQTNGHLRINRPLPSRDVVKVIHDLS